jgi:hypothetical protein
LLKILALVQKLSSLLKILAFYPLTSLFAQNLGALSKNIALCSKSWRFVQKLSTLLKILVFVQKLRFSFKILALCPKTSLFAQNSGAVSKNCALFFVTNSVLQEKTFSP